MLLSGAAGAAVWLVLYLQLLVPLSPGWEQVIAVVCASPVRTRKRSPTVHSLSLHA